MPSNLLDLRDTQSLLVKQAYITIREDVERFVTVQSCSRVSVICEERGECIAGLVFVEAVSVILGDVVSLRFGLVSGVHGPWKWKNGGSHTSIEEMRGNSVGEHEESNIG